MLYPFCPDCFSKKVSKKWDLKKEKSYLTIKALLKLQFRLINVINVVKSSKQTFLEIVEDNSNFTHEFKRKCLELVGLFFGSVRNIAYRVKKDTGVDISHQTI